MTGYFELDKAKAHVIAAEVGKAVSTWRQVVEQQGLTRTEISRMASALTSGKERSQMKSRATMPLEDE